MRIMHTVVYATIMIYLTPLLSFSWTTTPYNPHESQIVYRHKVVHIPSDLGEIQTYFQSPTAKKTVVYLQDMHCDYDVQRNIAKILKILGLRHHLSLVGLEGAWLPLEVTNLANFKLPWARLSIADYLVQRGRYTGAEYAAVTGNQGLKLVGIENRDVYLSSLDQIKRLLSSEPQGYLLDLKQCLEDIKPKLNNQDLIKLDKVAKAYRQGTLPARDYGRMLLEKAEASQVAGKIQERFRRFLNQNYRSTDLTGKREEMDAALQVLEQALRAKLYTEPNQRRLDELLNHLDILEKIMNISATPSEVAQIQRQSQFFRVQTFLDFITQWSGNEKPLLDPAIITLDAYVRDALRFYQAVDQRSAFFVRNLLKRMDEANQDLAVLVCGGYHERAIAQALKEKNINFISIRPCHRASNRINPYFRNMMGEKNTLEKILMPPNRSSFALPIQSPQVDIRNATGFLQDQLPGVATTQKEIAALKVFCSKVDALRPGEDEPDVKWSPDHRSVAIKTESLAAILTNSSAPTAPFTTAVPLKLGKWTVAIGDTNAYEQMAEWVSKHRDLDWTIRKVLRQGLALAQQLYQLPLQASRVVGHWLRHLIEAPQMALAGISAGYGAMDNPAAVQLEIKKENVYLNQANQPPAGGGSKEPDEVKQEFLKQVKNSIAVNLSQKTYLLDGPIECSVDDVSLPRVPERESLLDYAEELSFLGTLVQRSMGYAGPGPVHINRFRFETKARRWARLFFMNMRRFSYLIIGSDARKNPTGSLVPGTFFKGLTGRASREVLFFYGEGAHARNPLGQLLALAITPSSRERVFKALPDKRMFKIIASSKFRTIDWKAILAGNQDHGHVDVNGLVNQIWTGFEKQGILRPKIVMLYREHHQELIKAFASKMDIVLNERDISKEIDRRGEVLLPGPKGKLLLKLNDDWSPALDFNSKSEEAPHMIIGEGGMPQALLSALIAQKLGEGEPAYTMAAMVAPSNHIQYTDQEIKLMRQYQIQPGQIFGLEDLVEKEEAQKSLCVLGVYQDCFLGGQHLQGPTVLRDGRTAISQALITSQGVKPIKLYYEAPHQFKKLNLDQNVVAQLMTSINLKKWKWARTLITNFIAPWKTPVFEYYLQGRQKLGQKQDQADETEVAIHALRSFEKGLQELERLRSQSKNKLSADLINMETYFEREIRELALWLKQHFSAQNIIKTALIYSKKAIAASANNGSFDIWSDHIRLLLDPWLKIYDNYLGQQTQPITEKDKLKFLDQLFHKYLKEIQEVLFQEKLGDGSPLSAWQFLLYATVFDDFTLNQQAMIMDQWRDEIFKDPENYMQWTSELIERSRKRRQRIMQAAGMEEDQKENYSYMPPNGLRRAVSDQAMEGNEPLTAGLINQGYFSQAWDIIGAQARILLGLGLMGPAKIYFDRWQETMENGIEVAFRAQRGMSNIHFLPDLANLYYEKYLAFGEVEARQKAVTFYKALLKGESLKALISQNYGSHGLEELNSFYQGYVKAWEKNTFVYFRPSVWKKRYEHLRITPINALDRHLNMDSLPEFKALRQRLPQRASLIRHGLSAFFSFVDSQWQDFSRDQDYQTQLQVLHQAWQNATYVEKQALGWAMRLKDLGFYLDPEAYGHEERGGAVAKDILDRLRVLPEIRDLTLRLIKIQSLMGQARLGEIRYASLHRALVTSRLKFSLVQIMHTMEAVARLGHLNALSQAELDNIIHFNNQAPAAGEGLAGYRLDSFRSQNWRDFDPSRSFDPKDDPKIQAEFGPEANLLLHQLGGQVDMVDHVRHLALDIHKSRPDLYLRLMKLLTQLSLAVTTGKVRKDLIIHSDYGHLRSDESILKYFIQILEKHPNTTAEQVAGELKKNNFRGVFGLPVYIEGRQIWLRLGKLDELEIKQLAQQRLLADGEVTKIASQMSPSRGKRMHLAWQFFKNVQDRQWNAFPPALQKPVQRLFRPWFTSAFLEEQMAFLWAVALHDVALSFAPGQDGHEDASAQWADTYLKKQKVSTRVRKMAVNLIRYHSYLGQVRLGERRESLLLSKVIFKSRLPFWMVQALNALDVIAQKDNIKLSHQVEQLGEIMAYPRSAEMMAQHYDQYRLETMARSTIAAHPLNQIAKETLKEKISQLFGKEEGRYRKILKVNVDLLDNIVHLSHALVQRDPSFDHYVKWMRLLAQLAASQSRKNMVIRTDIRNLEASGLSLTEAVEKTANVLSNILKAIPAQQPLMAFKQVGLAKAGEVYGIPFSVSDDGKTLTLHVSRLLDIQGNSNQAQKHNKLNGNQPLSHYAVTMAALVAGLHILDMGLWPHVIAGLGLGVMAVRTLWESGLLKPWQRQERNQPRQRYRIRRTLGSSA